MSNEIINSVLEKYFNKKIIDIGRLDIHDPDMPNEMQVGEYS